MEPLSWCSHPSDVALRLRSVDSCCGFSPLGNPKFWYCHLKTCSLYSLFFGAILSKEQDLGPFLAGAAVYRRNESASGCALLGCSLERLAVAAMFVSTHSSRVPRGRSVSACKSYLIPRHGFLTLKTIFWLS